MTSISKLSVAVICCFSALSLTAQNTFPGTGAVGIGTVTPQSALDIFTSDTLEGNALQINPYFNAAGQATGEIRFPGLIILHLKHLYHSLHLLPIHYRIMRVYRASFLLLTDLAI